MRLVEPLYLVSLYVYGICLHITTFLFILVFSHNITDAKLDKFTSHFFTFKRTPFFNRLVLHHVYL